MNKKRNPDDLIIHGDRLSRDALGRIVTVRRADDESPLQFKTDKKHLNKIVGQYALEGVPCLFKNEVCAVMTSFSTGRLMLHSIKGDPEKQTQHVMIPREAALKLADEIYNHWNKDVPEEES